MFEKKHTLHVSTPMLITLHVACFTFGGAIGTVLTKLAIFLLGL